MTVTLFDVKLKTQNLIQAAERNKSKRWNQLRSLINSNFANAISNELKSVKTISRTISGLALYLIRGLLTNN